MSDQITTSITVSPLVVVCHPCLPGGRPLHAPGVIVCPHGRAEIATEHPRRGQRDAGEGPRDPEAFLRGFLERAGAVMRLPSPLPPPLAQSAALLRDVRSPGEAVIPLDELCRASFPKLVVSGGHHPVYEKICDTIADGIGGRRVVIEGAGHTVQATGERFNDELERLWTSAAAVA